ncbi:GFA family protein [Hyphomonas oceanitis]|uniref:Glutathione-dependent formaldehyde-activating protein n=1 Tax=Hyphomonas oceanitis SCH89 TaxID=1280953 RepID=A0A059G8M1_9PROT|nr:GFA family protein [Hyphomonas oceanitis]KDA02813.1 glutathione-dependent formaldehyde-activating protein [Hyphomonas oceanitis SCH89]
MAVTGGCLCGNVRFTYDGEIGPAGYCHCADCRRCTGAAYALSVRFVEARFDLERGTLGEFAKVGESGHALTRHFCVACGSPVYTSSARHPEFIYVKAGVIDDASIVHPTHQIWTQSRVSWAEIADDIESFERSRT